MIRGQKGKSSSRVGIFHKQCGQSDRSGGIPALGFADYPFWEKPWTTLEHRIPLLSVGNNKYLLWRDQSAQTINRLGKHGRIPHDG
jgi:hypothetical protein